MKMRFKYGMAVALVLCVYGCADLADTAFKEFDRGNYRAAARDLAQLAGQGNTKAKVELGYMYQHGYGVNKDEATAMRLFLEAAKARDVGGYICLGVLYVDGEQVPHDYAQALELFEGGHDVGDARATHDLAEMYGSGLGVKQDADEAKRLDAELDPGLREFYGQFMAVMRANITANIYNQSRSGDFGYKGDTTVGFSVRNRVPFDVRVLKSSGYPKLDEVAVGIVERTQFQPMPPCMLEPKNFQVNLKFSR